MANSSEYGRRLSEAQRQHLMQLILAMNTASAKRDAANGILQAQVEIAQRELETAEANANAFLRYCGNELNVTFDDGKWRFDQSLMCFVRTEQDPSRASVQQPRQVEESEPEPSQNGVVEHAKNLT
jgi:hypothetical protein